VWNNEPFHALVVAQSPTTVKVKFQRMKIVARKLCIQAERRNYFTIIIITKVEYWAANRLIN